MMQNKTPLDLTSLDVNSATGTHHARLVDDLVQTYQAGPPPARLDAGVLHAIQSYTAVDRHSWRAHQRGWSFPHRTGFRVAAVAATLLLALSGGVGYMRFSGPQAVSAQTVLRRAASAMALGPNQAAHFVYTVSVDGGQASPQGNLTGAADVWVQTDAGGAPALSVESLSMGKSGMNSRYLQVGSQLYAYNPEMRNDNVILLHAASRGMASWVLPPEAFDGATVAQQASALAQHSPQSVSLLPQQTLDGYTVDVVEVNGWTNRPAQRTLFYFDSQTYMLRGFDATSNEPSYAMPSWQARLSSNTTMAPSVVPASTFTLGAPPTARIQFDLADPVTAQAFDAALTATCQAALNVKQIYVSGQSPLAACQVTAPGVTAGALVAALAASDKAALATAVTQNVLGQTLATTALDAEQAWLTTWVTTPLGPGANQPETPVPSSK